MIFHQTMEAMLCVLKLFYITVFCLWSGMYRLVNLSLTSGVILTKFRLIDFPIPFLLVLF